ncbi:MAG: trp operon repressor [Gammaproteobacteria bacterium]|nr:trp operon repressor [Gammaproteobacteria bacterium]
MNAKGWHDFLDLCLETKNRKTLNELFELFLTAEERSAISMRYLLIQALLKQHKTQREIADHLKVSIAKITRGSNELKRMNQKFLEWLQGKV